jgi:hypothetical protein
VRWGEVFDHPPSKIEKGCKRERWERGRVLVKREREVFDQPLLKRDRKSTTHLICIRDQGILPHISWAKKNFASWSA